MKTICILSGGMDSTVLAYMLAKQGDLVGTVTVNYGQKHAREIHFAERTARKLNVPHTLLDLSSLRNALGASALTSDSPIPEGHYAEDNMKATVVPNRNMILLSLAAGVAITAGAEAIAYGAHAGDHAVYPDCRPEFADAMAKAIELCDYRPLQLIRPFINMTKADLVTLGVQLGVPFKDTQTCYNGGTIACGRCGTCVERLEAFYKAGAQDNLPYADETFWQVAINERNYPKQPVATPAPVDPQQTFSL